MQVTRDTGTANTSEISGASGIPNTEVIRCKCSYITSVSADKSFVTAEFINDETKRRFKCKGKNTIPPYCSPSLTVNITGKWTEYVKDGKRNLVFDVLKFEPLQYESEESFLGYLQTCYKGVGPKTAVKILNALNGNYKDFEKRVLEDGYFRKAVGKKLAISMKEQAEAKSQQDDLYNILHTAGISERKINDFRLDYGTIAMEVLTTNPFVLYEQYNIPFSSADTVCIMLSGVNPSLIKSEVRIKSCAKYVLKNLIAFQGHTYASTKQLVNYTLNKLNENKVKELKVTESDVAKALNEMLKAKEIVCGKIDTEQNQNQSQKQDQNWYVYDRFYYEAENYISDRIAKMVTVHKTCDNTEEILRVIKESEEELNITLETKQREAVMMVLNNKFSVITGSAGTGKTTVLKVCIKSYQKLHRGSGRITLAAPTGRAAMRMALSTKLPNGASTIHSLLGLTGKENENEIITPNQVETDILFVDEASMCEIGLFYKLLYNTDEYAKIVLIGDPNQLPPVGAGEVLKSIIESKSVPVTKLSVIYRQLETSTIVYNATKIMNGDKRIKTGKDFVFYPYTKTEDIKNSILYAFKKEMEEIKDIREVQIITPLREKGELSALSFNKAVQEMVNPLKTTTSSSGRTIYPPSILTGTGLRIRKGDKVICQKNTDVAKNGDIGIVLDIDSGSTGSTNSTGDKVKSAIIQFEGQEPLEVSREAISEMNLTLGYAITVHKSQGSEFKSVLMPVALENKVMLRRNLFYTSVTRARDKFIIAGGVNEVMYSIDNNMQDYRRTCLAVNIKNKVAALEKKQQPKQKVQNKMSKMLEKAKYYTTFV